ncbi:MAG: replication factor C large subunit [Candidatus Marsarchaeota archaeon]|nr:replication factor C large subunit [Candidatus Marsarchaeota archaeon]
MPSFCEKYVPLTLNTIIGNRNQINRLINYGADIQSGKRVRPILIYGPTGTGKTAAVHAFAYSNGFEIIEFDASDYRDAETLQKRLLPAMTSRNLFGSKIIVIFDEIDEISAKLDKGVEGILSKLFRESKSPILLTANDYWDRRLVFLREHVERIEFKKPGANEVAALLQEIIKKEGISMDSATVDIIASRANGDVRAAMNDLEAMVDASPALLENLGMRDRKVETFAVLDKIFTSRKLASRNAALASGVDKDMLLKWIDQNIPVRYLSKKDVANAYSILALASRFNNNASRTNYYGYLRYANDLMSGGVSLQNTGYISTINPYLFPSVIRYLSTTKTERQYIKAIATKLSPIFHVNRNEIVNGYMPLLKLMMKNGEEKLGPEETTIFMERNFNLEKEEADFIKERESN